MYGARRGELGEIARPKTVRKHLRFAETEQRGVHRVREKRRTRDRVQVRYVGEKAEEPWHVGGRQRLDVRRHPGGVRRHFEMRAVCEFVAADRVNAVERQGIARLRPAAANNSSSTHGIVSSDGPVSKVQPSAASG